MTFFRKLPAILTSIFLCFFLSFPVLASSYVITDIETPYGTIEENVPEQWKVYYYQNGSTTRHSTWYGRLYLNNEYVYCAQVAQLAFNQASDYIPQDVTSYVSVEKGKRAAYIVALGYGLDKSQEMDWATQVRLWQEIDGTVSSWEIPANIQAKIDIINARLAILDEEVSFKDADITLHGYGIENGITLTDENGIFSCYVENGNPGIHTKREGNTLTLWAEIGDLVDSTLSYSCFYNGNGDYPGQIYASPTSQDVFKANYPITKSMELKVHIESGSVSISKKDITGQEELKGAQLCILDENENVIDSWISGDTAHIVENLTLNKTYYLTETVAPEGYAKANTISFVINDPDTIETI